MKIASLIIGITLMVLSGLGVLICLILPGMTRNISFEESMMAAIPLAVMFLVVFLATIVSAVFVMKSRKSAALSPVQ